MSILSEARERTQRRKATPSANGVLDHSEFGPGDGALLTQHLTDAGNAQRFARLHGENVRYCHPWSKWLCWDDARWREDDTGLPMALAKATCTELLRQATEKSKAIATQIQNEPDTDKKEKLLARLKHVQGLISYALKIEAAPRLAAMLSLSRSEPGIPILPDKLNADPWALNCPNGTVDLRTGKLRPHLRDDNLTQLCHTPFDPDAECPTFLRFLNQIFPESEGSGEMPDNLELIAFVKRLFGYCLTGDVREQLLPICWGSGANGKSTLLNTVMGVMGPDYCIKAPTSLLTVAKGERHPTELATLFGKRFAPAIETDFGARLNESLVKEMTGGDILTARRMREDFWSFTPTHKLLICSNHKPVIKGRDHAIWRRLRLIPFVRQFQPHEQDKTMPARLAAEAPGILAWMVAGCLEWQAHGLSEPAQVMAATAEYRSESDVLASWLAECCDTGPDFRAKASHLFASFNRWADRAGEKTTITRNQLCAELRQRFQDFTSDGLWFRGIGIRHDDAQHDHAE